MSRIRPSAAILASILAATAPTQAFAAASQTDSENAKVCKYVTTPERGTKPFKLCRTEAEWAAKEKQDAKDANRIVCRYEDVPGSKFKSRKICQPASEWAEQRRLQRQHVEEIQMRTCVPGAGC